MWSSTTSSAVIILQVLVTLAIPPVESYPQLTDQWQTRRLEEGYCMLPPPLENGRFSPAPKRCPKTTSTPACQMTPGTPVPQQWAIFNSCNPGYKLQDGSFASVCLNGTWTPPLPICVVASCQLPLPPTHGRYGATSPCRPHIEGVNVCRDIPGSVVPDAWRLQYTCNQGYHPTTSNMFSVCENGVWNNEIECIEGTSESAKRLFPLRAPYRVPSLKPTFNTAFFHGSMEINNIDIQNFGGNKIHKFQTSVSDFNNQSVLLSDVIVSVPRSRITANWNQADITVIGGKKMAKTGSLNVTVDEIKIYLIAQGGLRQHNGTYFHPVMIKVSAIKPDLGNMEIEATDIIEGDPVLSKTILKWVNGFWKLIYNELQQFVSQQLELFSLKFVNDYAEKHNLLRVNTDLV